MPSRYAPQRTSHRRPPSTGPAARLAARSGLLLTLAVALAVLATGALVVPGSTRTLPRTVDAAAIRNLAATDGRSDAECRLEVPVSPLSATGLATPYQLRSAGWTSGDCHETNPGQAAFVEAVVYDPATHSLAVYHPLVVDQGARPAAAPVPVQLPANAVVGLWFGFNGATLHLTGPGASGCVDGVRSSSFGHFAYCNASAFFAAVNKDSQVVVPPVGTGRDGLPCPTSRDFSVVDQHQADYVATAYRVIGGRVAQDTGSSRHGAALTNLGGRLLGSTLDPALGCHPFTAPDLTDGGTPTTALALDELSAAANQTRPAALVPGSDPLVRGTHGRTSVRKTNVYRAGVDQPPFPSGQSRAGYCERILQAAPTRLTADAAILRDAVSPVAQGQDLLSYLALRLQATLSGLGCRTTSAVRELVAQAAGGLSAGHGSGTPAAGSGGMSSSAPASSSSGSSAGSSSSTSSSSAGGSSSSGPVTVPLPPNGPTLWGSSVMAYGGESYTAAFDRVQQILHPQIIRFFNGGTNGPAWPSRTGTTPLAISFKIPPAQVLDGSHDTQLRAFFAATPRTTFWTYWHEPEDDAEAGAFTPAQYRAAWAHIAAIAKASGKPLVSTLILMGWTAKPGSHRTWTDYYPGPDVIDVLAWDCYATTTDATPESMYGPARAASIAAGKPWAIGETAASASRFPDPASRQALLMAMSHYLATSNPKPVFVTYFDSDNSGQVNGNISTTPTAAAAWLRGQAG